MVTYDQLREHLGRRPFQPFRILLKTGEGYDITRLNQAATMRRRVFVTTPDDHFRWVWHEQIDRLEPLAAVVG